MRIIIANYRYFVAGGPERYMIKFMDIAQRNGIECIPFTVDYEENIPSEYSKYFVSPRGDRRETQYENIKKTPAAVWRMLNSTIYNFEAKRKLRKLIRDTKPDCVYIIHEINSLSPSIIDAAKAEGVRVVHRISDFFLVCANRMLMNGGEVCDACVSGCLKPALQTRCVKNSIAATYTRVFAMKVHRALQIFQKVDAWVVPSAFTRRVIARNGLDEERFFHVPTFIDATVIQPSYLNDGSVLFLGRISPEKGVIYAIRAMNRLKDTGLVLKITGTPDPIADQNLLDYISENGLSDRVQFVGFQSGDALKELIRNAICIVCPAIWYENMPNTVVESYAYGKPVVASRLGSLAEIVEDGKTGFLFEPKNDEEMADKLRILYNNPEMVINMGRYARKKCEEEYNENLHFDRVIAHLRGDAVVARNKK